MNENVLKSVIVITALLLHICAFAQEDGTIDAAMKKTKGSQFLDVNYKVTKPLFVVGSNDGSTQPCDETKHKVSFEIINFGTEGNTVLMTLDLGTLSNNCL